MKKVFPIVICALATLFYVYDYFIQVSPSVMTHQLMRTFGIGAAGLGVLSAAFYYSYTLLQVPAGLLLDRFGARKLLTVAALVSAGGVTVFAQTHVLFFAGVARFLIGLGSAFAFISALFLISRWFAHRHFALLAGLVQLGACVGSLIGLAPLAKLVNAFGWREVLTITGIITFALAILFWWVIRDGVAPPANVKHALHDEKQRLRFLLRKPQLWWTACCGLLSWVPVATVGALWGVPYLMRVYGLSNSAAGAVCSLFWVGLGLGSPAVGWFSAHIARRCLPIALCFALGFVAAILLYFANALPLAVIGLALFLLGISSSVQSLSFGVVKDIVPPSAFATASGFNNMAAILGGAISQPLVGWLLHWQWDGRMQHQIPVYTIADYRHALLVVPVVALLGVLVAMLRLKETYCRPQ